MNVLEEIKETLTKNKPYLSSKYSLSSIGLFGAIVKDDFMPGSEIDIIVDFKKPIGIEIIDLTDELEKLLNHKVDLVAKTGIEKGYYKVFRKEILYIWTGKTKLYF